MAGSGVEGGETGFPLSPCGVPGTLHHSWRNSLAQVRVTLLVRKRGLERRRGTAGLSVNTRRHLTAELGGLQCKGCL